MNGSNNEDNDILLTKTRL